MQQNDSTGSGSFRLQSTPTQRAPAEARREGEDVAEGQGKAVGGQWEVNEIVVKRQRRGSGEAVEGQ